MLPGASAISNLCIGWEQLKSIIPFAPAKKPTESSTEADEDKAFTVVFTGNNAIHLVARSNGRSRDEWVAAFSDLASGLYTDLLKSDSASAE